jgi:lambda family phage portal protein
MMGGLRARVRRGLARLLKRAVVGLEGVGAGGWGFAGARVNRLTLDWATTPLSADQEIQGDLRALRARSRELVRNTAYAKRFLQLLGANVVGAHGIRLQARIRSADGRPFESVNQKLEEAWARWGQITQCTVDRKLSWRGVQRLLMSTLGQDGEFFLRLVPGFDNECRFALQLIDADLLDETYNLPRTDRQNEVRMGVELDRWGAPVQYWFWTVHPSETGLYRERRPIPADEIIHGFIPLRVGQTRGVPWFHPVLLDHRMLAGYQEAELVASRMAAAKPGFFEVPVDAAMSATPDESVDRVPEEVEPGILKELPPGYTFKGWDPTHPSTAYKDFVKAILRAIAAGLGVSYHALANDLEGVNYSSARVGELADRDEWRALQQWMIDHVHCRIYEEWLKMALLAGELPGLSLDYRNYLRVAWRPRGWAWVDPQNELNASEKELQLGLNSRTRQAAEQGRDFEELLEDLAEEQRLIEAEGLSLGPSLEAKPAPSDVAIGEGEDGARFLVVNPQVHAHVTVPPAQVRVENTIEPAPVEVRPMPAPQVTVAPAPAPSVTVENRVEPAQVSLQLPPPKTHKRKVTIQTPKGPVTGEIEDVA